MTPQRQRAPRGLFFERDGAGRYPWRANLPQEDLVIRLFADLVKALGAVQEAHDEATTDDNVCDCDLCYEVKGILYTMVMYQSAFEGNLFPAGKDQCPALADLHAAIAGHKCLTLAEDQPVPSPAVVSVPTPSRPLHYWQPRD